MKLSIIVPVYNAEGTLDACVESIVNQDFKDWELLLVDDGSPDKSGQMCESWARRDRRICALHKRNGGLSDARNFGISHAKGDFITFIDSDDELAEGTLLPLMLLLRDNADVDVIEYSIHVHAGNSNEYLLTLPDNLWSSPKIYWNETMAWEHTYACNKVYRKYVLEHVKFPKGRLFEDSWFWPQVLAYRFNGYPLKVLTTSKGLYIYKWNQKGITVSANRNATKQLLFAQLRAAWLMQTNIFNKKGWLHYRGMICRIIDIIKGVH